MAINYTYPVKAVPTVSDNVLIIDNEDTTNPRATKTATIQSIVNLASGGGGVSSLNTLTGALTLVGGNSITAVSSGGDTVTINLEIEQDLDLLAYNLTSSSGVRNGLVNIVSGGTGGITLNPATGYVTIDQNTWPNADGSAGQVLITDGGGLLSWSTSGDVTGPASSVNNSIAVYDGTTGKVIKNDTGVTIDADSNVTLENWPESDGEFRGDVDGGIRFTAQADGDLSKGDVVYISGASGAITLVAKAQANGSPTMPAFGFANRSALNGTPVQIITFGNIYGSGTYPLNTTSDSEGNPLTIGDEIYVSSTIAGGYTNVKPSSEANLIQNIGKIVRVNANNGVIKVGGAGRTNATPNLDSAKIFVGNASNQSASVAMSGDVTIDNAGVTTVNITATEVPYGNGSGALTSEAAFTYDDTQNKLRADQIDSNISTSKQFTTTKSSITSSAGTATWDAAQGAYGEILLTENTTLAITNLPLGTPAVLKVIQDGASSFNITAYTTDLGGSVVWPGGAVPTITAAVNSVDIISFLADTSDVYAAANQDFK